MQTTRLTITDTRLTDDGNYACSVKTTGFPPIVSDSAHLYVYSQYSYCVRAEFLTLIVSTFCVQEMYTEWRRKNAQSLMLRRFLDHSVYIRCHQ